MNVDVVYLAFVLCSLAVFWRCRPEVAAVAVFLGGWVLLPVGHFPAGSAEVEFPYWITGLAVPSDMLLTKAWVAPAAACLGALVFDRPAFVRLRPAWIDLPVAAWCLWPLLQSAFVDGAQPAGWLSSAYLIGSWGSSWLLGRLYFAAPPARLLLARGLALSALACLPFSAIEGIARPALYGAVFEPHPFRFDGAERYVGFRPIGFFEHGNQFGLWVSLCALAAVWVAAAERGRGAVVWRVIAVVVVAQAVAAQSIGALALLLLGAALMSASRFVRPRAMAIGALAVLVVGGAVYASGAVPVMKLGRGTAVGQYAVEALRSVGRGSFAWRVSQDQKMLADVRARPLAGSGHWDTWRPQGIRPWGLSLLVLMQFGAIGLALSLGALLWPAVRAAMATPRASGWAVPALPWLFATLIALTTLDALVNSFIFFPAILLAGALAVTSPPRTAARAAPGAT